MSSGIGAATGATSTIGATSPLAGGFSGASIGGASGATGSTGGFGSFGSSGALGGSGGIGAIVGVGPAKTGPSILTPNKQATYENWEFWYDPRIELLYKKGMMNAGMSSGSLNSQPASSFGATGSTGSPFSNGTFGSSPGSGATAPTGTPLPTTPGQSSAPQ